MKQKHFIDSHKGVTALAVFGLIALYHQWHNQTAWVYLALHGGYGLLWVLKSRLFPDKQWEQRTSLSYGLVIWAGLTLYWVSPWLIMSRSVQVPGWYLSLCIGLYIIGVFFHFSADMQKHITLQLRPNQLMQGGLWSKLRNPNYFGELLIYLAFSLLSQHWVPLLILILFIGFVWLPNMQKKDRSLARYADFEAYRRRSKLFIPFLY